MKPVKIFESRLNVVTKGTGCVLCPALRYRIADEQRICFMSNEVLPHYKTQRGERCQLQDYKEREEIQ